MPYSVSVTEWDWRSMAQKTWTQNAPAAKHKSHPAAEAGTNRMPTGLNHRIASLPQLELLRETRPARR